MKKTRVFVLLLLSLVLTLGAFTACQNNTGSGGDETTQNQSQTPSQTIGGVVISPTDYVTLDNLEDYTLVYPDTATDVEMSVYLEIRAKIKDTYSTNPKISTDFVKRGDTIPTDTLEILIGKTNRAESVNALEPLRNSDWCVGLFGKRVVILGATDASLAEAKDWFCENCFTENGLRLPNGLYVYYAEYNYQEISINGVSLKEFVILTDKKSENVANAMQRAITFASGYTPEVLVSQPQNNNRINVKIDDTLAANEWKYYCEDGQVYIYGEDADALKAGYSYFIDAYVTNPDSPKIVDGIADSGVLEQTALVSFNLPTSYGAFETQSYTYDANTLWANFLEAKAELPTEVTVLDSYDPEDYPMSMKNQIFVATDGDANNPGTKEAPVATIQQALDLLSSRGAYGGVIWVRGGHYSSTAVIDADNTGFDASPLFICAYEDEEVVLTGYYSIKGSAFSAVTESDPLWERMNEEAREHILVADLNALGIDVSNITAMGAYSQPYVFVNDVEQKIATFPNDSACWEEEYLDESGVDSSSRPITMIFNPKEVPLDEWTLTDDMWITGSLVFEWTRGSWRATTIDLERYAVTFENYNMWDKDEGMTWRPNWEWHFINFIEILDMESEWYIDRDTGLMYYYPTSDFNADATIDILGYQRTAALSVEGASHVIIKNLSFYKMNGCAINVATVKSTMCTDVVVDGCYFEKISSKGAFVAAGNRVGVIHSEFLGCGVNVTGSGRTTLTPSNNFVQNCYFHGYTSNGGGVGFGGGVGDIFSHNLLVDCGFTMNASNECIVEYNEVVGGPYGNLDTGYIYCPGANLTSRGNHIRYNYFHDNKTAISGIYLDIHNSGQYIYGNVVTQRVNYGRLVVTTSENIVYNNILGCSNQSLETNGLIGSLDTTVYDRYYAYNSYVENEFWDRYQQYYRLTELYEKMVERAGEEGFFPDLDVAGNEEDFEVYVVACFGYRWIKNNVFFDVTSSPAVPTGNSVVADRILHGEETNIDLDSASDVGFTDYENGDLSLTEDSVVYDEIPEWEEIPFDKIGLLYEVEIDN